MSCSLHGKSNRRVWITCSCVFVLFLIGLSSVPATGAGGPSGTEKGLSLTAAAGTLPGDFVVDGNGAATYRIPIEVPPGTAGMEPELELLYSSHQEDGLLGVGWTLNGLSAIARCPATRAQDGFSGAVRYDSSDRFCLDGQRLIAVSGADGGHGTVYHTERQSWLEAISFDNCGHGPCRFEVETKDGSSMVFGATDDSRIEAVGQEEVRVWALSHATDRRGNRIEVTYLENAASGDYAPEAMFYTANEGAGLPAQRAVFFDYEGRRDLPRIYLGGSPIQLTLRLSSIETYVDRDGDGLAVADGANLVRRLALRYTETGLRNVSRLDSLEVCAADGVCLPETKVGYTTSVSANFSHLLDDQSLGDWKNVYSKYEETHCTPASSGDYYTSSCYSTHHKEGNASVSRYLPMELDGDGDTDLVEISKNGSDTRAQPYLNNRDGRFSSWGPTSLGGWQDVGSKHEKRYYPVDVDLDGRSELIEIRKSGDVAEARIFTYVVGGIPPYLFEEMATSALGAWENVTSDKAKRYYPMDVDGDGYSDLVEVGKDGDETEAVTYLGDGSGGFARVGSSQVGGWKPLGADRQKQFIPMDADGDGMTDLVDLRHKDDETWARVWRSNGSTFDRRFEGSVGTWKDVTSKHAHRYQPGDVNGDGQTDLVQIWKDGDAAKATVWVNTGQAFGKGATSSLGSWKDLDSGKVRRYYVLDADGDGQSDLLGIRHHDDRTRARLFQSDGEYFVEVSDNEIGSWQNIGSKHEKRYYPMDVDADGMIDLVELRKHDGRANARSWRNTAQKPNLLSEVRDGLGGRWTIDYAPLTDTDVYQPGDSAIYPEIDVQPPLLVARSHAVFDGRGGASHYEHRYRGARMDVSGRGWLGFASSTVTDIAAGVDVRTDHHLSFPLSGLLAGRTISETGDGDRLEVTELGYESQVDDGVYRVRKTSEQLSKYTDDSFDYSMAKAYSFDAWDNVILMHDRGDVDEPDDDLYACLEYAEPSQLGAIGLVTSRRLTTAASSCGGAWQAGFDQLWERFGYDQELNRVSHSEYLADPAAGSASRWIETRFRHDEYGNIEARIDPFGYRWRTRYEEVFHTFPERVIAPRNQHGKHLVSRLAFDPAFGVPLDSTDPNGNVLSVTLDGFGRIVKQWGPAPDGSQVLLRSTRLEDRSDGALAITSSRRAWDSEDTFELEEYLDGLGRTYLRASEDRRWRLQEVIFDSQGRLWKESYPFFEGEVPDFVEHEYDVHNHLVRSLQPDGTDVHYEFDRGERSATSWLPDPSELGRGQGEVAATTTVDGRGRLVSSIDADGGVTSHEYDPLGRRTRRVDPKGVVTTWRYDSLGRLVQTGRPDTGPVRFAYDDAGRLVERLDAKGQKVQFTYDRLGRERTKKTFLSDGTPEAVTHFDYDQASATNGFGHLTAVGMADATYRFSYDAYGDVTGHSIEIDGDTYRFYRSWDPLGRLERLDYPDGSFLEPAYGENALLASLTLTEVEASGVAITATPRRLATYDDYDARGRVGSTIFENGVESRAQFGAVRENLGRLSWLEARAPEGGGFAHSYAWNRAGKLIGIGDEQGGDDAQSFAYDVLGRTRGADGSYGARSYTYDESGNPKDLAGRLFTYDPENPHQIADSADVEVDYDANGNLIRRRVDPAGGGQGNVFDYRYDVEDRLVEVFENGASVASFTYDASGMRLGKTGADGTRVLYLGAAYEVVHYPGSRPSTYTKYVDGPSGRVAAVTRHSGFVTLGASSPYHQAGLAVAMASDSGLLGQSRRAWLRAKQALDHPAWSLALPVAGVSLLASSIVALYLLMALRAADRSSWTGRLRQLAAAAIPGVGPMVPSLASGPESTRYWRRHPAMHRAIPLVLVSVLLSTVISPNVAADLLPGSGGAGNPELGTLFFVQDQITSTTLVTDEDGETVADLSYLPYGQIDESASSGTDTFRAKFTGKERDAETGLVYFGSRYYDPELGRFLTADPAAQFDSPYLYAAADPINHIDPDGELVFLAILIVAAIVGAYVGGSLANGSWNPSQWDWSSGKTYAGMAVGAAVGVAAVAGAAAVGAAITGGSLAVGSVSAGTIAGTAVDIAFITHDAYQFAEDPTLENGLWLALDVVTAGAGAGLSAVKAARGARGASEVAHGAESVRGAETLEHEAEGVRAEGEAAADACFSFPAGTDIAGQDGPLEVEDVERGMRVWGFDEENRATGLFDVDRSFARWSPEITHVEVSLGETGSATVDTTAEHPFFVDGRGWVRAADLEPGDRLRTKSGKILAVESISQTEQWTRVFNFEVEGANSYYASPLEVLTHNVVGKCLADKGKRRPSWKRSKFGGGTKDLLFERQRGPDGLIESEVSDLRYSAGHKVSVGTRGRRVTIWHIDHIAPYRSLLQAAKDAREVVTWQKMRLISNDTRNLRLLTMSENVSHAFEPADRSAKIAARILFEWHGFSFI